MATNVATRPRNHVGSLRVVLLAAAIVAFAGAVASSCAGRENDSSPPAVVADLGAASPIALARSSDDVSPFERTWKRTDGPVADGLAQRTWMWGPRESAIQKTERYVESPGGERTVMYFDKSRMEITHPDAVDDGLWYVTNGLLVVELVTGQMQTGDATFEPRQPAEVNVAGDPDDPSGPTYASFRHVLDQTPIPPDWHIIQTIDRAGAVATDPSLGAYEVRAVDVGAPTDHAVASPFWTFMQSSGLAHEDGVYREAPLFPNPFYATGYPITEAYWADVKVGGSYREVLAQCFERRCLTWTPSNPAGWQVEAGNVGQHYYRWRYESPPASPTPSITPTATVPPAPTATPSATATAPAQTGVVTIGPGAVDAWMRSIVRDSADRVWVVAMNNNAAYRNAGPGELVVYRASEPGVPTAFELVAGATVKATGAGTIPFADAAIDGQDRLRVVWVDRGAEGQPLRYGVFDLASMAWQGAPVTIDTTGLSGYGGTAGQGGVSLALGADGRARVAYAAAGFQTQIRARTETGAGWSDAVEPLRVEGAFVWHPALALAPNGDWHLAAYDSTNRQILATRDSGGGWSPAVVVATDALGPESIDQSPALLVTPDGAPTIVWLDGQSFIHIGQFNGTVWTDLPLGGNYFTHAPGLGVYADGALVVAGHDEAHPPNALNGLQGRPGDWGSWSPIVPIRADGSQVFRWAGAFSQPGAAYADLLFFDEDTNDDGAFDDQTLYYVAVPLAEP